MISTVLYSRGKRQGKAATQQKKGGELGGAWSIANV